MPRSTKLAMLGPTMQIVDSRIAAPAPKLTDPFYGTKEWRDLVQQLIAQRGRRCEICGAEADRLYGDHIVEIKDGGAKLDPANIQILDSPCHTKKTLEMRRLRFST